MAEGIELILADEEAKYFCSRDWTPEWRKSPSGKSAERVSSHDKPPIGLIDGAIR
jgi:hypothetical protein